MFLREREMDFLRDIPVRESITIDSPLQYEDHHQATKKRRGIDSTIVDLGLQINQDTLHIPELESHSSTYAKSQVQKHEILSADPSYRFISDVAGALRKEPFELFEEEDMARVMGEREEERLRIELDMRRTRITTQEKYDMIEKMRSMLNALEKEQTQRDKTMSSANALRTISRFLIDHNGFDALVEEARLFEAGVETIQTLIETDETIGSTTEREMLSHSDETRKRLFYYLFIYFRYFLDNDTQIDYYESLRVKLRHLVDYTNKSVLDKEEVTLIKEESSTTTTITTTDPYAREIGEMSITLGVESPWREANTLYNKMETTDGVKWSKYRGTETINLAFFAEMKIPTTIEREMVSHALKNHFESDYPGYSRNILLYLYGSDAQKEFATSGTQGLSLASDIVADGGHPPRIVLLIRRQFDDFRATKPIESIIAIVRAHLLWCFFNNTPWSSIADLLANDGSELIVTNMLGVFTQWTNILTNSVTLYKPSLYSYIRQVALYLLDARTDNGRPVLTLPPQAEQSLTAKMLDTPTLTQMSTTFDTLNVAFRGISERELVADDLFYRYLIKGDQTIFAERLAVLGDVVAWQRRQREETVSYTSSSHALITYPVLRLHSLFRLYTRYVSEYSEFIADNMRHIRDALHKARNKVAELVGDETVQESRANMMRPINSGFVKLKAEIKTLLARAYHKVQEYVPNLRGLPLEAFHSDSAYESGLTSAMVEFISVVAAENELVHPEQYKSNRLYQHIRQKMNESMAPLRQFTYQKQEEPLFSPYPTKSPATYVISRTMKRNATQAFQLPYITRSVYPSVLMY